MRIHEIQSTASALILGVAGLAAFGSILIEDGVTDHEPAILERLDTEGVCIVLGDIATTERDQVSKGTRVIGQAALSVFVFEAPGHTHSPSGLALVDAVVTAISGNEEIVFNALDRGTNEKGGVLTVIDFNARVMLGA